MPRKSTNPGARGSGARQDDRLGKGERAENKGFSEKAQAHRFKGTVFRNEYAKSKGDWEGTLDELGALIEHTHAAEKPMLPYLKLAVFGDVPSPAKCLRYDANVLCVSGFEGDHDAGTMTFDAAVAWLKKHELEGVASTSASYRPDLQKWRMHLPFSAELPPERRRAIGQAINASMGGAFAPESLTLSQSFHFGYVDGNEAHHSVVVHHGGKFVDQVFPGLNGRADETSSDGMADGTSSDKKADNFKRQARKTVEERLSEMEFGSDDGAYPQHTGIVLGQHA